MLSGRGSPRPEEESEQVQTPAEKYLVERLAAFLASPEPDAGPHEILDVGAGRSISIEKQLTEAGCSYICDRIDVEDCRVDFPTVRNCWQGSIDQMTPVPAAAYRAVFANYVIEHIADLYGLAREVYRVLAPGGMFLTTLPNTSAPEFLLAKYTPLWFHKLVRRERGWETHYAYAGIPALLELCTAAGFLVDTEKRWPFVEGYLWKYPLAGSLGRLYDKIVLRCRFERLMGNVCLVLRKPG